MPKVVSERQLAKREQILQGALRVFLQSGFAATSMDRVSAEAGVSKQTVYSHFQDKEGLFKALIERATIDQFRGVVLPEQSPRDPEMVLRQVASIYFTKVVDDPNYLPLMRVVISESEQFPALSKLYVQTVVQTGRALLSSFFEQHQELHLSDPEAVAQIFFGSMVSLVLVQNMLRGEEFVPLSRDRLIDSLIDLVLAKRNQS